MQQKNLPLIGLLLLVVLNYPLLSIVNTPRRVMGIPVLYLYVFGWWLLVIIVVRYLVYKKRKA
jgi:hypothetical protein